MPVLEMAALPPAAKLCLKSTIRCAGLTAGVGGYTGCDNAHPDEHGQTYATSTVWQLMALGLVRCSPADDCLVIATDPGIELNDCGVVVTGEQP